MDGWERLYALITGDMLFSGVIAIALLLIGYVCAKTSQNCVYSFHIGKSKDAAAGRFAMLSFALYIMSGLTFSVIGINIFQIEQNKGIWDRIQSENTIVYEIENPLTEWFDELYDEFSVANNIIEEK